MSEQGAVPGLAVDTGEDQEPYGIRPYEAVVAAGQALVAEHWLRPGEYDDAEVAAATWALCSYAHRVVVDQYWSDPSGDAARLEAEAIEPLTDEQWRELMAWADDARDAEIEPIPLPDEPEGPDSRKEVERKLGVLATLNRMLRPEDDVQQEDAAKPRHARQEPLRTDPSSVSGSTQVFRRAVVDWHGTPWLRQTDVRLAPELVSLTVRALTRQLEENEALENPDRRRYAMAREWLLGRVAVDASQATPVPPQETAHYDYAGYVTGWLDEGADPTEAPTMVMRPVVRGPMMPGLLGDLELDLEPDDPSFLALMRIADEIAVEPRPEPDHYTADFDRGAAATIARLTIGNQQGMPDGTSLIGRLLDLLSAMKRRRQYSGRHRQG